MTQWWSDLSRREQVLVASAGALFFIFALSLLVIRPITEWRSDAARKAAQARDGYEMVASAAALSGRRAAPAPQSATPLRQAITTSAVAAQIELIRIGTEVNGQIEVRPEPVTGDRLFQWLADLEARYGVTVAFADISRVEGGKVDAQVLALERAQ